MYKTETHLHTSEVSGCSQLCGAEMVRLYRDAGYSTVFVSDHFKKNYLKDVDGMCWADVVHRYFLGYENAKRAGDELGIVVLPALEIQLTCSVNHYLLYGADEAFYASAPEIFDMTPEQLYAYSKKNGVTVVQAHPYRDGKCIPTPECVDAIEAINANPRHENFDEKALAMAREHGLPVTSGSDAHRLCDVALGGVVTEDKINTTEDYANALLGGKLRLIGGDEV